MPMYKLENKVRQNKNRYKNKNTKTSLHSRNKEPYSQNDKTNKIRRRITQFFWTNSDTVWTRNDKHKIRMATSDNTNHQIALDQGR